MRFLDVSIPKILFLALYSHFKVSMVNFIYHRVPPLSWVDSLKCKNQTFLLSFKLRQQLPTVLNQTSLLWWITGTSKSMCPSQLYPLFYDNGMSVHWVISTRNLKSLWCFTSTFTSYLWFLPSASLEYFPHSSAFQNFQYPGLHHFLFKLLQQLPNWFRCLPPDIFWSILHLPTE